MPKMYVRTSLKYDGFDKDDLQVSLHLPLRHIQVRSGSIALGCLLDLEFMRKEFMKTILKVRMNTDRQHVKYLSVGTTELRCKLLSSMESKVWVNSTSYE